MRHFSADALIACIDAGELTLSTDIEKNVRSADASPHPHLNKKIRVGGDFYHGRPDSVPEPKFDFQLDYDFHKLDVDNLSHLFGKSCWEAKDLMSEIAHEIDPNVSGMSDSGGDSRGTDITLTNHIRIEVVVTGIPDSFRDLAHYGHWLCGWNTQMQQREGDPGDGHMGIVVTVYGLGSMSAAMKIADRGRIKGDSVGRGRRHPDAASRSKPGQILVEGRPR